MPPETLSEAPTNDVISEEQRWSATKDRILQPKRDALDRARINGEPLGTIDGLANDLRGWAIMLGI